MNEKIRRNVKLIAQKGLLKVGLTFILIFPAEGNI